MSNIDPEKRYTREHEWAAVMGDDLAVATIGISDHAQSQLGDVVLVELPEVGDTVDAMEAFGAVESPKSVSDLFSPIAGEIVEVNGALEDAPETVNDDPYGAGWIVRIRMTDPAALDGLMDAAAYEKFVSESDH